jgi:cytochrome P450
MDAHLPPGPRNPFHGLLYLAQAPWALEHWHRKYGDRFTVRLGPFGTFVFLVDLDDIQAVFRGDDEVFHAGEANGRFLERVLGPSSVLVTDEDVHLRQRRRLSGPFHGESVARLAPLMADIAAEDIETWPVGSAFEAWPHMRGIALSVIVRTVIGTADPARVAEARQVLSALGQISLLRGLLFVKPGLARVWPWTRYEALEDRANAFLESEIVRCERDADRPDVLAMMVRYRDEDGTAMSRREIRDQLVTMLLAGHETTATALAWTLERLVRHPAVLERATEAARDGDTTYLDAVITESLRVRPIITDVNRRLKQPVTIGPYTLPAGVAVDPAILLVQRSAKHYPNPLQFDPSRFVGRRPDPTIWLPFGGGNRRCIGAAFALTEMRVVLTEILTRVELDTTTARDEPARLRNVTLMPAGGARIRVQARALQPVG